MATKKCPDCAETVQSEARVCRFCGYRFAAPELASTDAEVQTLASLPPAQVAANLEHLLPDGLDGDTNRPYAGLVRLLPPLLAPGETVAALAKVSRDRMGGELAVLTDRRLIVMCPRYKAWTLDRYKTMRATTEEIPYSAMRGIGVKAESFGVATLTANTSSGTIELVLRKDDATRLAAYLRANAS